MLDAAQFIDEIRPGQAPPTRAMTLPDTTTTVGPALRAVRRARGRSLAEVAEATGISASFLSLLENDRSDITIGRLVRLLDFYGVSITDLLPGTAAHAYPEVIQPGGRRRLHSPAEGIDVYLLTPDTRHLMMPLLLEFEPGARLAEPGRHAGEEFVLVLEGALCLELEGVEPRVLAAGDSAYYPAERPHTLGNASADAPLRVICVDTPATL
jgi:transcriptional regulator with XRE-family HTH domain